MGASRFDGSRKPEPDPKCDSSARPQREYDPEVLRREATRILLKNCSCKVCGCNGKGR
jgi:hypothetical protein